MVFARLLQEDDGGYTVLINHEDYEYYMKELQEWLKTNPEIEEPRPKSIKKFVLTDEKIALE